jgi:hypothetical protein
MPFRSSLSLPTTMSMCHISNTATQSIPSTGNHDLVFNTVDWSLGSDLTGVVASNGIMVNTTGIYHIVGQVSFQSNAAGRRVITLDVVGFGDVGRMEMGVLSGQWAGTCNAQHLCTAGQLITAWVYQNSGSALTTLPSGVVTALSAVRVA